MDGLTRFLAPLLPAPCELDIEAYTVHFETQMYHGKLRKLLFNSYVYFAALARSCMALIMGRSGDLLPGPGLAGENVDTAASRWNEKDQGIWEIRGEPRDFPYSKLMCWAALDRAIALAPQLGAGDRTGEWAAARDEIRAAILERGRNEQAGAFTQAFGSEDLDASSLMLAITDFLPGDDPSMKATVDAIAARLTDKRGLVYR